MIMKKERRTAIIMEILSAFAFLLYLSVVLEEKPERIENAGQAEIAGGTEVVTLSQNPWLYDETQKISKYTSDNLIKLNKEKQRHFKDNIAVAVLNDINEEFNFSEHQKEIGNETITVLIYPNSNQYAINYNQNVSIETREKIRERIEQNYYNLEEATE